MMLMTLLMLLFSITVGEFDFFFFFLIWRIVAKEGVDLFETFFQFLDSGKLRLQLQLLLVQRHQGPAVQHVQVPSANAVKLKRKTFLCRILNLTFRDLDWLRCKRLTEASFNLMGFETFNKSRRSQGSFLNNAFHCLISVQ